jgi:PAS domain S-box-containing protein
LRRSSRTAPDLAGRRRLEESQSRLAALVESSDDAIVAKDLDGIITDWNRGAERIFGYTAAEVIGRSIRILLPPERQDEEEGILATLRRGERTDHFETVRVRKDGTRVDVSISVSPIKDGTGRIVGAAKIARDVSDRKRADAERERLLANEKAARADAEAASRAKDEFLSMVSHELRTPLASILAWVRVLRQGKLSPERTAQALNTIESNGRVQTELIEDLLDVSRIVAGRLRLTMRPVRIRAVIEAVLHAIQPDATAQGVAVSARLDADAPVAADPTRLQQVVSNILDNAIKFTPPGGRIDVGLERVAEEARITVRDTGRGIPREMLPRVFETFWQAEDVKSRKRRGLGLGLAIVHRLVQQHGGSVAIDSPGEGLGSTVVVTLPVLPGLAAAATPSGAGDLEAAARLDGVHVLIIDEEEPSGHSLRAVLEDRGAAVVIATSITDAVGRKTGPRPDVLICDVRRLGEQADASVDPLRGPGAFPGVPAVAISAQEGPDGPPRALAAGFLAYFGKPFDANVLVETLATLASREVR